MTTQTVQPEWDYTMQAAYYRFRPNYAPAAIDLICRVAGAASGPGYRVADVGAGTGNLTMLFAERGLSCVAIEPNDAMRRIGTERTAGLPVIWQVGTGERTDLPDGAVDLFAMGSSFNTTDRPRTLAEAHRALKPNGHFTCLWNHRELVDDPVQAELERIIRSELPEYRPGVRREDQAPVIEASGLFDLIERFDEPQQVSQSVDDYLNAWRSVRNPGWDLRTPEGRGYFERLMDRLRTALASVRQLDMVYRTTGWIARRRETVR